MTRDAWQELHAAIDGIVEHRTQKLQAELARLAKKVVELKEQNRALREERIASVSKSRSPTFLSTVIPPLVAQYKVTMDTLIDDVPWRDSQIPRLLKAMPRLDAAPGYRLCLYDLERASDMEFICTKDFGHGRLREVRMFIRATRAREAGDTQ